MAMSHRFTVGFCALAFLLWSPNPGAAQTETTVAPRLDPEKELRLHVLDRWTIEDGLPSNTVFDIIQDEDGYLWLATDSGLARFDGVRFTTFDTMNTPALGNNLARDLDLGVDGSLWIATGGGGLIHHSEDSFESLTVADGLPSDNVAAIAGDPSGTLWIGFEDGRLSCFRNGVITHIGFAGDDVPVAIQKLDATADGSIWITDGSLPFATGNPRLLRYHDGKVVEFSIPIAPPGTRLLSVVSDNNDVLWVGAQDPQNHPALYSLTKGTWETMSLPTPPITSTARTMYIDRSSALWLGAGAVYRVTEDRVDMLTTADGLPDPRIRSFFEDREGNFWIGTYGGGLLRIKNGRETHYPPYESFLSLYQSRDGALWGGNSSGLMRFQNEAFQLVAAADGRQLGQVRSIAEGDSGELWLATDVGLVRYRDGVMERLTSRQGLPGNDIRFVFADSGGRLWLALTNPADLVTFEDGLFSRVRYFEDRDIRAIHEDRSGTIWFGQADGQIHYLKDGQYTRLEQSGISIRAFHEDDKGHLWIATWGAGLLRWKDGVLSSYTKKDGLYSDMASWILEDDEGYLWMSTDQGIYGVSKQSIEDHDAGRLDRIPPSFTEETRV
jgi:ligand-binding sensor domain-containing protein